MSVKMAQYPVAPLLPFLLSSCNRTCKMRLCSKRIVSSGEAEKPNSNTIVMGIDPCEAQSPYMPSSPLSNAPIHQIPSALPENLCRIPMPM